MSFIVLIVVGFAYDVTRRHAHHLQAQQGIPISEFGVSTYGFLENMTIDRLKLIRLQVYKRARMHFFPDKHAAGTCFEMQVLVDKIRVPDWVFEADVSQELRGMGQYVAAYQSGMYLTPAQEFNKHDKEPSNYINQWKGTEPKTGAPYS